MLELATWRKTGDLSSLPPGLRVDVALHCISLALRMKQRILHKQRGWRFVYYPWYKKYWRKYSAMFSFYDGYIDDGLKKALQRFETLTLNWMQELKTSLRRL